MENKVLVLLEQYGVNVEVARKYLEANKHNHITTTYYLLLRKFKLQPVKESIDAPRPPTRSVIPKLPIETIKKIEIIKSIDAKGAKIPKKPSTSRSPIQSNYQSSPKPAIPSRSQRNSVSPSRKLEEMRSYAGPYNVDLISAKSPTELTKSLIIAMDKLRVNWKQTGYCFNCTKAHLRFNAEIMKIEGNIGVCLICFTEISGTNKNFVECVEHIIQMLNL